MSSSGHQTTQEICTKFQEAVSEYLIRHKSVLDVLTKMQEANARVSRAVAKATTTCGCVHVNASKQRLPSDISYLEMKAHMNTHVNGELCEQCRETVAAELGRNLFYITALCDIFDLDLGEVIREEQKRILTLGLFNLT